MTKERITNMLRRLDEVPSEVLSQNYPSATEGSEIVVRLMNDPSVYYVRETMQDMDNVKYFSTIGGKEHLYACRIMDQKSFINRVDIHAQVDEDTMEQLEHACGAAFRAPRIQ